MDSLYIRKKIDGKWFWMNGPIVEDYLAKIGVYGFAVYAVLCNYSNKKTGVTFVGIKKISELVRCSTKTVDRSLDDLVRVGLLEIQSGREKGRTNTYILLSPPELVGNVGMETVDIPEDESEFDGTTMAPDGATLETEGATLPFEGGTMAPGGCDNDAFLYKKNQIINQSKNNKTKKPAAKATVPELPDWIDRKAWDGYVEMRRTIPGKKATSRALELIIGKLEKFHADGENTTVILDRSVVGCWTDVYTLKPQQGGRNGYSNGNDVAPRTQRNRNAVAEVHARIDARFRAAKESPHEHHGFGGGYSGGDGD